LCGFIGRDTPSSEKELPKTVPTRVIDPLTTAGHAEAGRAPKAEGRKPAMRARQGRADGPAEGALFGPAQQRNLEIWKKVLILPQFLQHLLSRKAEGNGPLKP
jgi:hypothetical protein